MTSPLSSAERSASSPAAELTSLEMRPVSPDAVDTSAMTPTAARAALRAQAHDMLAALWVALEVDDTFGGLADGFDADGQSIQTEVGKFVFAELAIRLRWHHVRGKPDQIDE